MKGKTTAKKATKTPRRAQPKKAPETPMPGPASDRFVQDLLTRGDAAHLDKKGKLPKGATHVIRKKKDKGQVEVERARFHYF